MLANTGESQRNEPWPVTAVPLVVTESAAAVVTLARHAPVRFDVADMRMFERHAVRIFADASAGDKP